MSLLGIVGGLLGGIMGRNSEKKAIAAQNEYNKPINIRARAEEAGFNPLLFVGPGVGQQTTTGGTNYMGQAIADAGLMLADDMAKRRDAGKLSQLQAVNARLQDKVQSLTLRPKVGGIYAGNVTTPSLLASFGGRNAGVVASSAPVGKGNSGSPDNRHDLGLAPNPIAPGREKSVVPLSNTSGVFEIDNWLTGGPVTIPGDSEPWGLDELGTAAIAALPQMLWNHAPKLADGGSLSSSDRKRLREYERKGQEFLKKRQSSPRWWDNMGWPAGAPISGGW